MPVLGAFLFTSLLVLVQLLEHTDPRYSALTFCFFMLSAFAFNVAGGFSRPSGSYIFAFSLLAVELGTVVKAFLGEPAQTNLQEPILLMSTYVASMGGMLVAAYITRKIATTTEGIASVLKVKTFSYYEAALGCLVIYFALIAIGYLLPAGSQILHSLSIVSPFLPLSILLGTIAAVKDSDGRRSINAINLFAMSWTFWTGMLSFSKQGMITPIASWVIGLAWARFRFRFVHLAFLFLFSILAQMLLVPMSAFGRNDVVTGSYDERVAVAEGYLTHPSVLRHRAATWEPPSDMDLRMYYFNKPQGILDRLSMLPNDSVLEQFSNQGHYFGYLAIRFYFENWMPHLIDPHKLEGVQVGGNAYMHEMGRLADDDLTTGISFSPTAEAFHIDGWRGILLLAPAVWLLSFVVADSVCGDIRKQPLGLLYILIYSHVAPEGGLGGPIDTIRLLNIAFTLGIIFCGYVAPVIGMLLRGKQPVLNRQFRPLPTRSGLAPSSMGVS